MWCYCLKPRKIFIISCVSEHNLWFLFLHLTFDGLNLEKWSVIWLVPLKYLSHSDKKFVLFFAAYFVFGVKLGMMGGNRIIHFFILLQFLDSCLALPLCTDSSKSLFSFTKERDRAHLEVLLYYRSSL